MIFDFTSDQRFIQSSEKMKGFPLTVFLLLLFTSLNAQTITISGKIVDAETANPLPYANIQLEETGIGTISQLSGAFSLKIPVKYVDKMLSVSFMGYKIVKMPVANLMVISNTIKLSKEEFVLGDIIIMPDSTLLTLLKRAYLKIPDNYPMHPSKQKGFYRETAKYSENRYLYFSEAVIENYKSSYKSNSDNGQVKILKSITNEFPDLASIGFRFYQGIFMANEGDFVKKNADFINPRHFKNYEYSLSGITKYQNNEVYIISFDTKDDSLKGSEMGKIFIEKSSLAYIAFEIKDTERGISLYNKSHIGTPKVTKAESSAEYIKFRDKWHLKHVVFKEVIDHKGKDLQVNGEYISTAIFTDLVNPIPLGEQINYSDFFSEKAKDFYSADYWEEYDVLERDSTLGKQIKLLYSPEQSKSLLTENTKFKKMNNLRKVLSKFNNRFGLCFMPVNGNEGLYDVSYKNSGKTISLNEHLKPFENILCLNAQLDYNLNNKWALNFSVSGKSNKTLKTKSYDLGASYRMLLNITTKPLILDLSLRYSFNKFSRNFSNYKNNTSFKMGNKTIDAESLRFGIGYNTNGLLPQLGLTYQLKNKLWLYASTGYYLPVNTNHKLYVSEKSGFFLTRKSSDIKLSDSSLQVTYNGSPTTVSHVNFENYNAKLGVVIKF